MEKKKKRFSNEVSYNPKYEKKTAVTLNVAFCLLSRAKALTLSLSFGHVRWRTWEWLVAPEFLRFSLGGFCTSEYLRCVLQLCFLQTNSFNHY